MNKEAKGKNPYHKALDILSRRNHSEYEVRQKMKKSGIKEEDIGRVVESLKQKNLINDAEFARAYTDSLLRTKQVGPRFISLKLQQKNIAGPVIQGVIEEAYSGDRESELMQQAIEKWKNTRQEKYAKDKQRLARFLVSRGFSPAKIRDSV